MKWFFLLSWRYTNYHRLKTGLLTLSLILAITLPFAFQTLLYTYQKKLQTRANQTPILIGPVGSPYQLLFQILYFRHTPGESRFRYGELRNAQEYDVKTIPFYLPGKANLWQGEINQSFPIVATSMDYFAFRKLKLAQGHLPILIGNAVVGSRVAEQSGLSVGNYLISKPSAVFDLSKVYPLKMPVVGILAPTGTADDNAIFVDLKAAWIMEGIGHGHGEEAKAVVDSYQEITADNVSSFHFHGDPKDYPLSAIMVIPEDLKNKAFFLGDYQLRKDLQLCRPEFTMKEVLQVVFQLQRFLSIALVFIVFAVGVFLALIIRMSSELRKKEKAVLVRLGFSTRKFFFLQAMEIVAVLLLSLLLSVLFLQILAHYSDVIFLYMWLKL